MFIRHENCMQMNSLISQKALYACVTCSVPNAPDFSPAGICLACSYACHNDHTLVELYTKRQFRCDCGNSKFPKSNRCRLRDDKDTINEKNEYNQNYRYILQFNLETFQSFHKTMYPKPRSAPFYLWSSKAWFSSYRQNISLKIIILLCRALSKINVTCN